LTQLKQITTEASQVIEATAEAAVDKKAERIVVLDVSKQLVIIDHFVICSGSSERQVHAIADAIERRLNEEHGVKPLRREGHRESRWVVLDYIDFLVHVFHREERDVYDLERLWADAPMLELHQTLSEDSHEPAATAEAP